MIVKNNTITNTVSDGREAAICKAENEKLAKLVATYKTQMTIGYSLAAAFLVVAIFFILFRRKQWQPLQQ